MRPAVAHVSQAAAIPLSAPGGVGGRSVGRALNRRRLSAALPGIGLGAVGGTLGARVGASVLGFLAAIIAARALGPHGRAQLAVMIAVPGIFSVVGVLGLDNANARFAGRSHSAFRQLVRWAVAFSALAGSALASAWWFAGALWPALRLGLDPRLALLSAALCPVSLLLSLLGAAEVGRGRVGVYNATASATTAAYLLGVVLGLASGHLTVVGCFIACAGGQSLGVILLMSLASMRTHGDGERVSLRRYLSYALRAYLPNVMHYGMLRMDVPVIQLLAGTAAVALYAVALPIAEALLLLPTAVALVVFPRATSGAVDADAADRIGVVVVAGTALLACVIAALTPVIVPAVYGTPYRGAVAVVWSMLPGLVLFSAGRTPQAYLAATDRLRPAIVATAVGSVALLVCLAALTPSLGAVGAGAADSAGYLAFTAALLSGRSRARRTAWLGRRLAGAAAAAAQAVTTAARRCARPAAVGGLAGAAALCAAAVSVSGMAVAATAAGVVILSITLAVPSAGIYALAIALPVSQTSFGAKLITDKELLLLVVACLISKAAAGRLIRTRAGPVAIAAILACYLSASLVFGTAAARSHTSLDVAVFSVALLCLPLIAGADRVTRRALVLFGFTAACLAIAETIAAHASLAAQTDISAAASALVTAGQTGAVNHNAEGALFVLALGVLLALFPRARHGGGRLALAAAITALAVGVAFSFSRSSYFGALALIALFAARRSMRGLVGAAVGLGCLVPLLPAAVTARFGTVWSSSGLDASSALRLDLWSSAARMFAARPLFGVGYLNFADQLPVYFANTGNYDTAIVQFPLLEFAHNAYLSVLAETGAVGAALVGTLIVVGWRRAWLAARCGDWAGEAAVLGLVGMGVCSAFGEVLFVLPILAALVMVVLAARRTGEVRRDQVARTAMAATV